MKNVGYALLGNVFVAVWGRSNVSDAEFPQVLDVFRRLDFDSVRMLVVTEGGGPTPIQRKSMNNVLDGKELLTAVVTDDIVIRGTVTALSWFNKKIRSFPAASLDDALEYLDVPDAQIELVVREVDVLRSQIQRPKPKGVAVGR
jgi:hypothetical protein